MPERAERCTSMLTMSPIPLQDLASIQPWWIALWFAYLYGKSRRPPSGEVERRDPPRLPRRRRRRLRR